MLRRAGAVSAMAAIRRLSTAPQQLTRSQKFREHIFSLHAEAPARWTDIALAQHFQVPLASIQGVLALQELEAERASKGPLDAELCALGDDIEEYLDEDAPPARSSMSAAAVSQASVGRIETMSSDQERLLAGLVARRYATAASLPQLLESLSAGELMQLKEQLRSASLDDDDDGSAAEATVEGSDPKGARDKALRGLLASLALEVPPDDLSATPSLAPTSLPAPARLALAAPRLRGAGAPQLERGVARGPDEVGRLPVTEYQMRDAYTAEAKGKDKGDDARMLRVNLKVRAERLSPAARKWGRNRGGLIFTEVIKHKRQTKLGTTIERVWASDKGERGEVREANEDEEQRARARVLPVQLPPRIKRTV